MVPEEADQFVEKFDSGRQWQKRRWPLYEAQNDIQHNARDAAPQHRLCLNRHHHDAGSGDPGNQGGPQPRIERTGAYQVVGDQRGEGSGRNVARASVTRGGRVRPRRANAGAMRKNAMAAHDDSHRIKNSLTGIASTPSVEYGIAHKRDDNADHGACRHGNIRKAQELEHGDGHRARNRRDDIAARQALRKE